MNNSERRTQGTETSEYLEEKRTIVIPSVAASESGGGMSLARSTESHWKVGPRVGDRPVGVLTRFD